MSPQFPSTLFSAPATPITYFSVMSFVASKFGLPSTLDEKAS